MSLVTPKAVDKKSRGGQRMSGDHTDISDPGGDVLIVFFKATITIPADMGLIPRQTLF